MSGHSVEKVNVVRSQPVGMEVSHYTLKQLKQEAINAYFERLRQNGEVSMLVGTEVVDGVIQIKVSIHENLYV